MWRFEQRTLYNDSLRAKLILIKLDQGPIQHDNHAKFYEDPPIKYTYIIIIVLKQFFD